ncbi:MAG: tetratricopeptide repeat protein, partial [Acidobacteria bacterium]
MILRFLAIAVYCLALFSGLLAFGAAPRDACYRLFLTMALACLVAVWAFPVQNLFRKRFIPLFVLGAFLLVQIPLRPPVERYGYVFLALGWLALTFTLLVTRERPGHARFLALFLVAIGLFDAFYGLVQSLGGMAPVSNVDPQMGTMASGTFVNRNHFAGLLNMTIPVALGGLYATFPRRGHKLRSEGYAWAWIILLVTGFMGLAILLSWSRGGTLSLIASLVFLSFLMMLKRRRRENRTRLSAGAAWVLLLTTVLLGAWVGIDTLIDRFGHAEDDSTERLLVYRDSLRLIAAHPLGVGPKMYQYFFTPPVDVSLDCRWTHAHNDYLETAVEYGIPLALLFWGFVGWRLWRAGRTFLDPPQDHADSDLWSEGIALGCAGAIFSILLHSLVDFNLQIPINWVVFCMVLGLAWGRTPVRTAMGWKAKTLTAAVVTLFFVWPAWTVIKESVSMQIADRETIPGFEEALTWIPDQPAYHFAVGLLYRDNLEHQDLEQAGEHLEAATRLNPREWVYWQEVGRYYEFMGETERAEKAMLTCLGIMPLYASERWRLGNFYLREGRVAEALEQVKRAIELNPDYREATLMVFWKAGLGERELDRVWPGDRESRLMRVRFLVRNGASGEEIDRQWRQAAKAAEPAGITLEDVAFYLDHLSRQKAFDEL